MLTCLSAPERSEGQGALPMVSPSFMATTSGVSLDVRKSTRSPSPAPLSPMYAAGMPSP